MNRLKGWKHPYQHFFEKYALIPQKNINKFNKMLDIDILL
jgi:hypothetical protein